MSDPLPNRRPLAVEDTVERPPEWEAIEAGYGQDPLMREFEFDPIHGYTRIKSGPKIQIHKPDRPY